MVEWQDGTLVTPAHVNEDGTITPAVYEGVTPLSAYNLNKMQTDMDNKIVEMKNELDLVEQGQFKNVKEDSVDLDTVKKTGFMYVNANSLNTPIPNNSFYITTIALDDNYIIQNASKVSQEIKEMEEFERQCVQGVWTEWKNKSTKTIEVTTGEETVTGKTIDGKVEYRKRINCGTLPNATSLVVETGLSNVHWTRKPEGFAQNKTSQANAMPLPYIDPRDTSASISLSIISEYRIAIVATQDRSSFYGIVDVFYVKN